MTQSDSSVLVQLADEIAERYRSGEHVRLEDYVANHPHLEQRLREIFPALLAMGKFGSVAQATGPYAERPFVRNTLPERLGEYRILGEIARGGMGIVYEAVQESLGRHVALKVLSFPGGADPFLLERFRREAKAAANLHHTNIVPVYGVGEHDGVHYYAMQFIQGQGLDVVLAEVRRQRAGAAAVTVADTVAAGGDKAGRLSGHDISSPAASADAATPRSGAVGSTPQGGSSSSGLTGSAGSPYYRSVARVGVQVAQALHHAHGQGVLHRDVKPSNLLLDTQGCAWVADFGLAKLGETAGLTSPGDVVGTLRYIPPERFEGVDHARGDVYGLGLTLYEMLTLKPAFGASDRLRLIEQVRHTEPPRPRQIDPRVPRDLELIVLKASAKEPDKRYATARELADDLERFLKDEPILARRPSLFQVLGKWMRRHRQGVTAAAAALFLGALALAGVAGWVLQERAGRLARTDEKVAEALDESVERQDRAEIPEALEAVKKAESAVAAGGGDEALRARVAARRRDLEMVLQLEDVISDPAIWDYGPVADEEHDRLVSQLFARVFRDHGIDVEALDVAEAANRLRATTVRVEGAAALDLWVQATLPPKGDIGRSKRLLAIAVAADPDPLRVRVREALGRRDVAPLMELAADSPAEGLPPNTAMLLGRILVSIDKDKADLGLEVMRRAQRQHPGHFWLNHTLAHGLEIARPERWQEDAIRFASAALAARPTGTRGFAASQLLGSAFLEKGDLPESAVAYARAAVLRPDCAAAHLNLGVVLRAQGKLEQAADAFRKATQVKPDDYVAHDALGGIRESQKRYAEAAEAYQRAIDSRPDFAPSHMNLADVRLAVGDPAGAIKACEKAIEYAPDHGWAYQTKARAHKALGQLHEAEAALRKAIDVKHGMSPRYRDTMRATIGSSTFLAEAHCELGALLQAQRRLDEAADEYRKAIKKDGTFASAHSQLGGVYLQQEEPHKAIKHLRDALKLKEDHSGAHFDLGRAFQKLGQLEDAAAHYSRASELKPYQFWTDIQLGLVLERLHKLPEAEAAHRRAVARLRELAPKSGRLDHLSALGAALNNLALLLRERGELAEARGLFEEALPHQTAALRADGKNASYREFLRNHHWELAETLVRLGDHGAAARAAAELPGLYPDGWREPVRAAGFLARCAALAGKDAGLAEEKRQEVVKAYGDQAMKLLRQAAENGWGNEASLNAPAFDSLRSRDDFRLLLSELEKKSEP